MKRTLQIIRFLGLAALAVLVYVLMKPPSAVDDRVILVRGGAGGAAFTSDASIRNVLDRDITYTIRPGSGPTPPVTRTLRPGEVDRIAADRPVGIEFDDGSKTGLHTIRPGKPYSFRFDADGAVKVYPGSHGRPDEADLAPYVPTPPPVVERMLEAAGVTRDDVVYDIGCGDGRVVIAAAKVRGARGVGIDIDAGLIEECRERAREEGVAGLVRFVRMDATKARLREATVVTAYLLPESLETLRPLFERDLRPGARVVSHQYRVPGWQDRLARTEVLAGEAEREHRIYVYVMPGGK